MKVLVFFFILTVLLNFVSGRDDDENFYYANNNNKFVFNNWKVCQDYYYYDFDYFKCRFCDPNFNLKSEKGEFDLNYSQNAQVSSWTQTLRSLHIFLYVQF